MGSTTRYFPGGAATEVSSPSVSMPSLAMPSINGGSGSAGGFPDFSGILARRQQIEDERERRAAAMQRLQMAAMQQSMDQVAADQRFAESDRFRAGIDANRQASFRDNMQDMQLRAMMAEEQAQQNPPLRMVSGFNINPGYQLDTVSMNARQRRAFLPEQSINKPSEDAYAGALREKGEEFDPYYIQRQGINNARAGDGRGVAGRGLIGGRR